MNAHAAIDSDRGSGFVARLAFGSVGNHFRNFFRKCFAYPDRGSGGVAGFCVVVLWWNFFHNRIGGFSNLPHLRLRRVEWLQAGGNHCWHYAPGRSVSPAYGQPRGNGAAPGPPPYVGTLRRPALLGVFRARFPFPCMAENFEPPSLTEPITTNQKSTQ